MLKITSTTNPHIKQLLRLRERKGRKETGLTIVDGLRELVRAVEAKIAIKEIYICPELLRKSQEASDYQKLPLAKSEVYEVSPQVFAKICFGEREDGILGVCAPQVLKLQNLSLPANPFLVLIEQVEKPGNLGAILRTCDGAGVDALLISDEVTDIFNPNVIRASIGTVFSVPLIQAGQKELLQFLRNKHIKILATSPTAKKVYTQESLTGPLAIALGSEQDGLSAFWLKEADLTVSIPMQGLADSLNVSTSAAILIYESLRQRMKKAG